MSIQTKIEIAVGVDYIIRPEFTLAGIPVDPTPLIAADIIFEFYDANILFAAVAALVAMTPLALVLGANISVITPSGAPPLPLAPNAAYILLDKAIFAPTTAAVGRNGLIRISSLATAFDDIWIDFDVVRFTDSAFQNVLTGDEVIDVAANTVTQYPRSGFGGANNIAYNLQDGSGNATTVQPARRIHSVDNGIIPD